MFNKLLAKIFGTSNERAVKRLLPTVAQINALEPQIQSLTDDQLRAKTTEFRQRVADGSYQIRAYGIDQQDPGAYAGLLTGRGLP